MQTVSFTFIDTQSDLEVCIQNILKAQGGFVALDTEFIRQETYWPKLALIQISFQESVYLIDPLSPGIYLNTLLPLFRHQNFIKVFHSGRQDLEIFWHEMAELPTPVFDTQLAFTYLENTAGVGYNTMVSHYLNITLDKTSQHTNWLQRPLDSSQCGYAALDVYYLEKIAPIMFDLLKSDGRLAYVMEDCDNLVKPHHFMPDPDNAWRKVKHSCKTWGQLWLLQDLAAWRDRQAMRHNRIRGHILVDDKLNQLCRAGDLLQADLETFFHKHAGPAVQGDFKDFFETYRNNQENQKDDSAKTQKKIAELKQVLKGRKYSPDELEKIKHLQDQVDRVSHDLKIPKSFVASSNDIRQFLDNPLDKTNKIAQGWRHTALFEQTNGFIP